MAAPYQQRPTVTIALMLCALLLHINEELIPLDLPMQSKPTCDSVVHGQG